MRNERSFTLIEMMVAVAVLGILIAMVGVIYESSSAAVNQTNGTVEIYQKAEALRRQVELDVRNLSKEGYLILIRREYDDLQEIAPGQRTAIYPQSGDPDLTAQSDSVIFARTGDDLSGVNGTGQTVVSNLGWVNYGHVAFFGAGAGYGGSAKSGTATNPENVNRWGYGRRVVVHQDRPDLSAVQKYAELGKSDVFPYSFGTMMSGVLTWLDKGSFFYVVSQLTTPQITNPDTQMSRLVADGCGSVRVRFLLPTEDANGDGTFDDHDIDTNGDGVNDYNEDDGYGLWPPDNGNGRLDTDVWLDLPESTNWCAPGGYPKPPWVSSDMGVVVFGPESTLWPKTLEFTVRLYDRDLTVKSVDEDLSATAGKNIVHAGMTFTFVVEVPQ